MLSGLHDNDNLAIYSFLLHEEREMRSGLRAIAHEVLFTNYERESALAVELRGDRMASAPQRDVGIRRITV